MYSPAEDSFFLSEILTAYLKKNKINNFSTLDLGTGSAIQAETFSKFTQKNNILCSDIDNEALAYAKNKGFNTAKSDLFSKIKAKFDIISFNAPYLPSSKYDNKKDTTGGKLGDETILKFLKQVKSHLNKNGKIFLLFSSFTPQKRIEKELQTQKLKIIEKHEKSLSFEKLFVWIITL